MAHGPARPGVRPTRVRQRDHVPARAWSEYVDIMGFAVFRITSIDSNSVYGYAISGVYADMNDSSLRRGQVARLVPWN